MSFQPKGLRLSKIYWGFQNLGMFAPLVGFGTNAGQVFVGLVNCAYLFYLYSIYCTRLKMYRGVHLDSNTNRYGFSSILVVLFLAWGGVSLLWTPSPASATAFYMSIIVQVYITYYLCKLYPVRDVLRCACNGTAYGAAASVPLAIILTGYSGGRLGESDQHNMVSTIAFVACLGLLSVAYLLKFHNMSKRAATILMVPLLAGLFLTFAKTEIIAIAVALIVSVLLAPGTLKRRLRRIAWMVAGTVIALIAISSRIVEYLNEGNGETADTLSGRSILWMQTYTQIVNGPLIRGFGLLSFREIGPVPWYNLDRIAHAHNEFLTVWFNFGIVGVVLVFGSYFVLGFESLRAIKGRGETYGVIVLCSVVFSLVMGVTQASPILCVFPLQWLILFDCYICT